VFVRGPFLIRGICGYEKIEVETKLWHFVSVGLKVPSAHLNVFEKCVFIFIFNKINKKDIDIFTFLYHNIITVDTGGNNTI